jgi:hypothetical protein
MVFPQMGKLMTQRALHTAAVLFHLPMADQAHVATQLRQRRLVRGGMAGCTLHGVDHLGQVLFPRAFRVTEATIGAELVVK